VLLQESLGPDPELDRLASTYLAFLWYAFDANSCRFRNFMSHERQWLEVHGSEDSHARALWAVGTALGRSQNEGHRNLCGLLFQRGLSPVGRFSSPRAWAFTIVAIDEYLRTFFRRSRSQPDARCAHEHARRSLSRQFDSGLAVVRADRHLRQRQALSRDDRQWAFTSQPEILEIGLTSLRWLLKVQTADAGHFAPIGCHGFWKRGGERARFDQQPLEAHATVSACHAAFAVTGDPFWQTSARRCFEWFLGRNDLGLSLYDPTTGGCRDALLQDHLNQNQGAESSLAFYLSFAELTLSANAVQMVGGACAA
jgi:hypothetical protein